MSAGVWQSSAVLARFRMKEVCPWCLTLVGALIRPFSLPPQTAGPPLSEEAPQASLWAQRVLVVLIP